MSYKFQLKPLPYAYDALEPFIDAKTMEIHHSKHLQAYVDNLNAALEKYPDFQSWPLEKLLKNLDQLPADIQTPVRNNGGGVYNHDLFFTLMTPDSKPLKDGALKSAIQAEWGSVEELLAQMKAAGLSVFGSGWSILVSDQNGKLSIFKTPNQDTPIPANLNTVLNLDVWEHAYYLLRQNRRAEYIDAWMNVINWEKAEENYLANL